MLLTPTYHVFNMYKVHQDAELLDLTLDSGSYSFGGKEIPEVSASASVTAEGVIHVSLCNLNHVAAAVLPLELRGLVGQAVDIAGTTLAGATIDAHNTFSQPEAVVPQPFTAFKLEGDTITVELPAMSVTVLAITPKA
ncbi:Intracellular exo-alpha-L-arabinofuranosidase 2 [compost metagenome]